MMNLLGCNKDDFYNLTLSMNYKNYEFDTYLFSESKKRINLLT